jgi:hypothetical protein
MTEVTTTTVHAECATCERLAAHAAIMMEQSGAFEWISAEGDCAGTATGSYVWEVAI